MASEFTRSTLTAAGGLMRAYPGWRIVMALFLCAFITMGASIYSYIILLQPVSQAYHWSAQTSGTLVSAMWLTAPLALVMAPVIQRVGAWRLVFLGMAAQALGFVLFGMIGDFWQFYLTRFLMGVGKMTVVVAIPVIVAQWFSRRFGTAMSIVWSGLSAGGFPLAVATDRLLTALGYRLAAWAIAGLFGLFMLGAALLARGVRSPEDFGVAGVEFDRSDADGKAPLRIREFLGSVHWGTVVAIVTSVVGAGMASIGFQSHQPALLVQLGFSASFSASVLGITPVASLVGVLIIGWMLDRTHERWSSLLVSISLATGLFLFAANLHLVNPVVAGTASLLIGFAFGAGEMLWIVLVKRQFGTPIFPFTYGGYAFALGSGYAAGGTIVGRAFDLFAGPGIAIATALMYLPTAVFSLWRPGPPPLDQGR